MQKKIIINLKIIYDVISRKKFPNITVDAISFMGDNLRINVLDEAVKNKKKVVLFWYPKDFTFVCPTELHAFQAALQEFEKEIQWLLVLLVIQTKFTLHG